MNTARRDNRGGRSGGRGPIWRPRYQASSEVNVAGSRPVGDHSGDASTTPGSGAANMVGRYSEVAVAPIGGITQKFSELLTSDNPPGPNSETIGFRNLSPNAQNSEQGQNVHVSVQPSKPSVSRTRTGPGYYSNLPSVSYHSALGSRTPPMVQSYDKKEEKLSRTMISNIQHVRSSEEFHSGNNEGSSTKVECEISDSPNKGLSFDICEDRKKEPMRLKPSLFATNKAARNEKKRHMEGEDIKVFRPGMILLKGHLSLKDQVKLIKSCRDLGRGPGGFYQPGYRDGATLHLKMMCLGKHWEPQTGTYCDKRSFDEAKPPPIPDEFLQFVQQAIQVCHGYLESHYKGKNVRSIIPSISPNICIINFYTKTGKLGLHQDKDESQESLCKGLPVVSFSIGDTAEFLFGDHRDIDKADKVNLESGDVLIFGGESRHIFHGVSSISPNTAPKDLINETNLKAGRLNLTFREY